MTRRQQAKMRTACLIKKNRKDAHGRMHVPFYLSPRPRKKKTQAIPAAPPHPPARLHVGLCERRATRTPHAHTATGHGSIGLMADVGRGGPALFVPLRSRFPKQAAWWVGTTTWPLAYCAPSRGTVARIVVSFKFLVACIPYKN